MWTDDERSAYPEWLTVGLNTIAKRFGRKQKAEEQSIFLEYLSFIYNHEAYNYAVSTIIQDDSKFPTIARIKNLYFAKLQELNKKKSLDYSSPCDHPGCIPIFQKYGKSIIEEIRERQKKNINNSLIKKDIDDLDNIISYYAELSIKENEKIVNV